MPSVQSETARQKASPEGLRVEAAELRLSQVALRDTVELLRLDLPEHAATPLMERGVLPGCRICPVRLTPSGDPVLLVDGTLLALRREVASCLCVRRAAAAG
jgi:Fe2+ transport system protein FeoA